nr:hypothetical protein [Tanacetum cinerariifolium]
MQIYLQKQQFKSFSVSNSEGLHKGYDRFQSLLSQLETHGAGVSTEDANQKFLRSLPSSWSQVSLIMRTKPGVDTLNFDDLYNNLRVIESNVKCYTRSSSSSQNMAFVILKTLAVLMKLILLMVVLLLLAITHKRKALHHTLMISCTPSLLINPDEHKAMVTVDGEGVDWTGHAEDEIKDYALMAYNPINSGSDTECMQTRSSSRLVGNPSSNPTPSTNPNPKGRNRRRSKQRIKEFNLDELSPLIVTMVDQRTMDQLLQAPTEGYGDAIVVPAITADNFELTHGLLTLVQNKQFFGHDKEDLHAHVRYFNKITSTLKFLNVPNRSNKLMLFPFSLEGAARIWLEKEPPRSIFTWDDLISKFINQFSPPSKTTNLCTEITYFQQRFDESFTEAWDKFKDLLRACPHHGFSKLHQLDTLYNALNSKDQDSLNSAVGGNFLGKMPRECLAIIKSKFKVRYSRNKPVVAKVSTSPSTSGISPDVVEPKDMVKALLLEKKSQNQSPTPVKAVEESYVTCGGAHSYHSCPATVGNVYRNNIQEFVSQASAVNYNQRNTSYRPPMMSNQIRPPNFPPVPNNQNVQLNQRNNQNHFILNHNRRNNFNQGPVYQPLVFQPLTYQAPSYQASATQTQGVSKEDFSAYVKDNDAVMRNMQTQCQNMQNQLTNLTELITKLLNSNSTSTLSSGTLPSNTIANPRMNPTNNGSTEDVQPQVIQSESLILNSEPVTSLISEPVIAPVSAPKPNPKSSIPYPSRRNDERNCKKANNQIEKFYHIFKDMSFEISFANALILMPKFASTLKALIGNKEKLSEMARTPLNKHWSAVLLNNLPEKLGAPSKFLIPCELTLRVGKEAITFNLDQTSRYSANYSDMTAKRIDVIDMACKEYSHEVLGFSDVIVSGNPTPFYDPIISSTLTPFKNNDFHLEEAPTVGYEDAIVVPAITADNFKLKHGLLTLFQNKQFFGHDKEDPHAHV